MGRMRVAVVLVLVAVLAAVGPPADAKTAKPKPKPTTTTTTAPPAPSVLAASVGSLGTVLVDARGLTLYRYLPEANGKVACTGGCAAAWPPLLRTGSAAPVLAKGVAGKLGTITRPDRSVQVTYGGIPLYRFVGDTKKGTANGQGSGDAWYVVHPGDTLATKPAAATTTTTAAPGPGTTTGGGGGGGGGGYDIPYY